MMYEVSGYLKFNNEESFSERVEKFTDVNDATDYYTEVFGDVARDLTDIGGEFVLMLTERRLGEVTMLKRHTINTTFINA